MLLGRRRKEYVFLLILLVIYAILPLMLPISLASEILIFGVCVLGYDILFGHTGLLSFGHAAYFGLGCYGAGFLLYYANLPPGIRWLCILSGIALATIVGATFGALSLRRVGAYFALITLAFAQMVYFIFLSPLRPITGGENGLIGLPPITLEIPGFSSLEIVSPLSTYYFILPIAFVAILIVRHIINSPVGIVFRAIRENEERVIFLGYNVYRYKLLAFILSSIFGGLAGALYVIYSGQANLFSLEWMLSGEIVIMNMLGGQGTLYGPLIGAAIFIILRDFVANFVWTWRLIVGIIIVCIVLFMEGGVWGAITHITSHIREKLRK